MVDVPAIAQPNVPNFDVVPRGAPTPASAIDTRIYGALAPPEQIDPVKIMNQVAQTQQATLQNKLLQRQIISKNAMGELAQKYFDPEKKEMDWSGYSMALLTDPRTAAEAPEIAVSLANAQKINLESVREKLGITAAQLDAGRNAIVSLLQEKGDFVTHQDVIGKLSGLVADGMLTPQEAMGFITQAAGVKEGPQLRKHIEGLGAQIEGPYKTAEMNRARLGQTVTTPQGTIIIDPGFMGGNRTPIGFIPNPHQVTAEETRSTGLPEGATVTDQPSGPMFQSQAPSQEPTSRPFVSDVGPQTKARLEGEGKTQADYKENLDFRAAQSGDQLQQLNQLKTVLQNVNTGGGWGVYRTLGDIASALGASGDKIDAIANKSYASTYEFDKLASQLVLESMRPLFQGAGGIRIAGEFYTLKSGFPSGDMPKEALNKIIDYMSFKATQDTLEQELYNEYVLGGEKLDGKTVTPAEWPAIWQHWSKKAGWRSPPQELMDMLEKKKDGQ